MLHTLRSADLLVTVAPEHGCTITGISLVDDATNILWSVPGVSARPLPAADLGPPGSASAEYFDRSVLIGGWFPMFPSAGPTSDRIGGWMHGEAPRLSWHTEEVASGWLSATLQTPASGFLVRRMIRLAGDCLMIVTTAENASGEPRQVVAGEHPCFDRAVFAGGFIRATPGASVVASHADPANARLVEHAAFAWPEAPTSDGDSLDLSRVPAESDGRHEHVLFQGIDGIELVGPRHHVTMRWDASDLPHALLWQHFRPLGSPWAGDVFAIEPMLAPGRTTQDAIDAGACRTIAPGASLTTTVSMRVAPR